MTREYQWMNSSHFILKNISPWFFELKIFKPKEWCFLKYQAIGPFLDAMRLAISNPLCRSANSGLHSEYYPKRTLPQLITIHYRYITDRGKSMTTAFQRQGISRKRVLQFQWWRHTSAEHHLAEQDPRTFVKEPHGVCRATYWQCVASNYYS
jgi:hypothetical protein